MNGPEHYCKAEQYLTDAAEYFEQSEPGRTDDSIRFTSWLIAQAQVHATLALAAATASPLVDKYMGDSDLITQWANVIGWTKSSEQVKATIYCGKPVGDGECGEPEGHGGDCKNKWECPF